MKLDIVYGLLDCIIRNRVQHDKVNDLEQIIEKVRLVEMAFAEVSNPSCSVFLLNPSSVGVTVFNYKRLALQHLLSTLLTGFTVYNYVLLHW